MTIDDLARIAAQNALPLTAEECSLLQRYAELLREWNARINLISRKDEENILSRHVLHALTLRMPAICDYDFSGKQVLDIGTGGGLPGIPFRIVTPMAAQVTLLDSIQKKIAACTAMIEALSLPRIRAVSGRAEELSKLPEESMRYDVVISRAVAPLDDLIKWTRGLVKPGTTLYSLKGGDLTEETKRARRMSTVRGVEEKLLELVDYSAFASEEKKLVRVQLA